MNKKKSTSDNEHSVIFLHSCDQEHDGENHSNDSPQTPVPEVDVYSFSNLIFEFHIDHKYRNKRSCKKIKVWVLTEINSDLL